MSCSHKHGPTQRTKKSEWTQLQKAGLLHTPQQPLQPHAEPLGLSSTPSTRSRTAITSTVREREWSTSDAHSKPHSLVVSAHGAALEHVLYVVGRSVRDLGTDILQAHLDTTHDIAALDVRLERLERDLAQVRALDTMMKRAHVRVAGQFGIDIESL